MKGETMRTKRKQKTAVKKQRSKYSNNSVYQQLKAKGISLTRKCEVIKV